MSGPETRPLDQVAADIIAADVAATGQIGRPLKVTGTTYPDTGGTGFNWGYIAIGMGTVLIFILGVGFVGGFFGGGTPNPSAPPSASPSPAPTASPTPTASPSPTPTASPSPSASPSASPSPSPTPPVSGQSLAIGTFDRLSGTCPIADTFDAAFDFLAEDDALTMTQVPVEHVTTGTVTRTGVSEGTFVTAAEGQSYQGTITGSTVRGTLLYTVGGCDDTYEFELRLDRPFLAPPPYDTAPGFFELLDAETFAMLLALPPGQPVHLVVGSVGQPDVTALLPIHVVLLVDGITPWDFMIEGNPSAVCRGPTGCSADAPSLVDAAWLTLEQRPLLVAYGADGAVIAVYAPNGTPLDPLSP